MDHLLCFRIFDRDGPSVGLSIDGAEELVAPLDLDWQKTRSSQSALGQIARGNCELDQLKDIGAQLWQSLLAGPIGPAVEALRAAQIDEGALLSIRLSLPPESGPIDELPWEALFDMDRLSFVAPHPRAALVRHPSAGLRIPALRPRPPGPLRMLVVIPERSGLGIEHEWSGIQLALQAAGAAIEGGAPVRLDGPVTPDRLAEKLEATSWDIVHIIGHGRVEEDGSPTIRLNGEGGGEAWLPGDAFAPMFAARPPRLVVLNCCLGASPDPRRGFAGLGPLLLGSGVRAVVAMRYEIADNAANAFARAFYAALAGSQSAGFADLAVTAGRLALQRNFSRESPRSFVTPVLFLAPGERRLFELGAASAPAPKAPEPRPRTLDLPADLVAAVAEGRCIPVVGPGLLTAVRSGTGSITPRALLLDLAARARYPHEAELRLGESAGDWVDLLTLQRVCQHFEHESRRPSLTRTILAVHAKAEPPPALRALARWKLPGVVSTHFDGLLQRAFDEPLPGEPRSTVLRAVWGVDQAIDAGGEGAINVHLRGSIAAPDSLVLTEQDHDELWDRLGHLAPAVASLVTGALDRALLFVGVSPRDGWAKRLARQLRPPRARNAGPVFMVTPERSPVDEECWNGLDATWIKADPSLLVEELTDAARGAR
ncbi:MAG: CHAT domain-containing protein [Byssovorax sp.]